MLTKAPPIRGAHRRKPLRHRLGSSWGRRAFRLTILTAIGLAALGAALLYGLKASRDGVLPNVEVAGVKVGGLSDAELRRVVRDLADRLDARTVTVARPALEGAPDATVSAAVGDLGYGVDVEATVRAVLHRGRQGNPVASLADQLGSTFVTLHVDPIERIDDAALGTWIPQAIQGLTSPPTEGDLAFSESGVSAIEPEAGATVDQGELREAIRDALAHMAGGGGSERVVVLAAAVPAKTTPIDVAQILGQADQVLAGSVRLTRGDAAVTFRPKELAQVLDVRLVEASEAASLELLAVPERVDGVVSDKERAAVEKEPVDATFKLVGGKVKVVASKKGFRFDPEKAAGQLVDVGTSENREAKLKGVSVDPDLTTKEAKALRIDQQVSTFTTYHDCCAPRVTNIHRIADIIRGAVVMPGEEFSINDFVGPRTQEKGFVNAPAISEGEFVEQIGGGISQFATTTYNAIFFGGYQILEHQAHSYWFTRYPMGREATVSWPAPDLRFRNDSDYGIYIQTSYTDTSITVTFYGHQPIDVETTTGSQTNFREPEVRCEEDPSLANGQVEVVQSGIRGFDVTVTRILRSPDGHAETETYFTRYKAEPIIEHRKTCPKKGSSG